MDSLTGIDGIFKFVRLGVRLYISQRLFQLFFFANQVEEFDYIASIRASIELDSSTRVLV